VNLPIIRLSRVVTALFAALLIATTVIQFAQAPSLRARPDNRRTLLDNYSRARGAILLPGDQAIASSKPSAGELAYLRSYPQGPLYSHVTGYYSFVYGAAGLEAASDDLLSGSSDALFYKRVSDLLSGKQATGASLQLTLNPKAQAAASKGLGNQRGAVVAINPKTGAILAMVSHPAFDPNDLAGHDLSALDDNYKKLNTDPQRPLVNRSINGDLYPPGSIFKVITAAAALSSGEYTEDSMLPGPAVLELPGTTASLPNMFPGACGANDQVSFTRAMAISCNTAFASVGMDIGADALRAQAEKFGFGDSLSVPMRVTPSTIPAELNMPQLAQSSIGQFDVRVTALQMAMVAAGIANQGTVMRPYLVYEVQSPTFEVLRQTEPEVLTKNAVSTSTADQLTDLMVYTVDEGTASPAAITGVPVAGKTGTAKSGNPDVPPYAWFVSFAPAQDPEVAVAVMIQKADIDRSEIGGGLLGGPIAKAIMEAVIQ